MIFLKFAYHFASISFLKHLEIFTFLQFSYCTNCIIIYINLHFYKFSNERFCPFFVHF